MVESLSAGIKVISAKIEAKISPDVYNISTATVSNVFNKNFPLSPSQLLPPMVLSSATPVGAENDDMKQHSSIRDSVKVTNLASYGIFRAQSYSSTTCL
ncbi:hypothetical protein ACTXT7_001558 [Hymenolepis weldensis]